MDAQHEKDLGMCLEIAAATAPAVRIEEDVADGGHTGGTGAGQHLFAVGVEFLAVQMGVAVAAHAGQGLGQGIDTFNFLVAHGGSGMEGWGCGQHCPVDGHRPIPGRASVWHGF